MIVLNAKLQRPAPSRARRTALEPLLNALFRLDCITAQYLVRLILPLVNSGDLRMRLEVALMSYQALATMQLEDLPREAAVRIRFRLKVSLAILILVLVL